MFSRNFIFSQIKTEDCEIVSFNRRICKQVDYHKLNFDWKKSVKISATY